MRIDPSHCPGISKIEALGKGGLSLGVYAVLAVLYAVVGRQMLATVGEPYQTAMNQQVRIEATLMLFDGLETRNIMQLQAGLTKAAELPTFNETLFADGRSLLGGLRQRMEALTAAVEAAEPEALGQALDRSIELHADGRPYVDRYHLRLAAKKLNAIVQAQDAAAATPKAKAKAEAAAEAAAAAAAASGNAAAAAAAPEPGPVEAGFLPLFERVKAALQLGRGSDDEYEAEEEPERKLPSKYLPSFFTCFTFVLVVLLSCLVKLAAFWSVEIRARMYFHPRGMVDAAALLKLVPPKHRGKPEVVPIKCASDGRLLFTFQRQQYEVAPASGKDASVEVRPLPARRPTNPNP